MTEWKKAAFLPFDPCLNQCNCLFFSKWCMARTRESCCKKGTEWWSIILLLHICEIGDLPDVDLFGFCDLVGVYFLRGAWAMLILCCLWLMFFFPAGQFACWILQATCTKGESWKGEKEIDQTAKLYAFVGEYLSCVEQKYRESMHKYCVCYY